MTLHHEDGWLTVHGGDNREVMRTLPAGSVQCVVTSPPYWGLRDYGTASWDGGDPECDHRVDESQLKKRRDVGRAATGTFNGSRLDHTTLDAPQYRDTCGKCGATRQDRQLGLEPTLEAYVAAMVDVFREVRRVLRADGTLWLNLGDSYAATTKGSGGHNPKQDSNAGSWMADRGWSIPSGLKPKDLVGIPWRVAFALQADGWYLRSDIIWAKLNPMPESVTDRPTKAHEYLFLLSKSASYHYDADAIREPSIYAGTIVKASNADTAKNAQKGQYGATALGITQHDTIVADGRNRRSVWTIATKPYPGAHFATFPEALVEPCILAGTSQAGACATCGAPWERVVERERARSGASPVTRDVAIAGNSAIASLPASLRTDASRSGMGTPSVTTTGWQRTCAHEGDPVPCVVMDPFAGTGTVGLVANRLSRRALLIDLNADYLAQCLERNRQMPLGVTA